MSAGTTTLIQSLMSLFPIFNQPLATSEVSLTALKGVVKKKKKKKRGVAVTQKNSRTHSSLNSVQQNRFQSVHGMKTARLFGLFWSPGPKICLCVKHTICMNPVSSWQLNTVFLLCSSQRWLPCVWARISGPKRDELSYCCEMKHGLGIGAGTS